MNLPLPSTPQSTLHRRQLLELGGVAMVGLRLPSRNLNCVHCLDGTCRSPLARAQTTGVVPSRRTAIVAAMVTLNSFAPPDRRNEDSR